MSADLTEQADRLLGYGGFHRMAWARFYGDDDGAFQFAAEFLKVFFCLRVKENDGTAHRAVGARRPTRRGDR